MALFALVPMLIAVRAGRWLDAVGPRKPLAVGAALLGAGAVMPGAVPYAVADIAPLLVRGAGRHRLDADPSQTSSTSSATAPTRRGRPRLLWMAVGA